MWPDGWKSSLFIPLLPGLPKMRFSFHDMKIVLRCCIALEKWYFEVHLHSCIQNSCGVCFYLLFRVLPGQRGIVHKPSPPWGFLMRSTLQEGADVLRAKCQRGLLRNNVFWTQDLCTQKLKAPAMDCMNLHKAAGFHIHEWIGEVLRESTLRWQATDRWWLLGKAKSVLFPCGPGNSSNQTQWEMDSNKNGNMRLWEEWCSGWGLEELRESQKGYNQNSLY